MNTDSVLVDVAVKDLSGAALDWAVGKALGWVDYPEDSIEQGEWWYTDPAKAPFSERIRKVDWKPSSSWRQGGPLIGKYQVNLHSPQHSDDCWAAWVTIRGQDFAQGGFQPLIAVCRAIVASQHGDIVKVPACLVTP